MAVFAAMAGIAVLSAPRAAHGAAAPAEVGVESLLGSLGDLAQLPRLLDGSCRQFSSYDRSGGNGDLGRFLNGIDGHLPDNTGLMADMDGPGAVVRLWSANPAGTIRIYLDGSDKPVIEAPMADLFAGKVAPLAPPLATTSSGGSISYFPIPYQKHCRITVEKPGGLYYHVDYRTFAPGTPVRTFSPDLTPGERAALARAEAAWRHPAPDWSRVRDWRRLRLKPAATTTLAEHAGPGTIRGLYVRLPKDQPEARRLVLRAYWEGEAQPSLEAPLTDLFGSGWGTTAIDIASLPMGRTKDGWYFRLPMPFRRSARLTLTNEGDRRAELQAAVDLEPGDPDAAAPWGYLHARWRRAETEKGTPHEWLQTDGRGQFVGVVQCMSGAPELGFLEGDELIWSDGEKVWNGTGTEDYFNSGWYFKDGPVSQPLHGAVRLSGERGHAEVSAYRFHLNDAVPFHRDLRAAIEHGGADDSREEDYASVAFWYAERPEPAGSRPALTATALLPPYRRFDAPPGAIVPAHAISAPPPGTAVGWIDPPMHDTPALLIMAGKRAAVPFTHAAGRFKLRVAVDRRPHLGRLSVAVDGRPVSRRLRTASDGDPEVGWLDAGEVELTAGDGHTLELAAADGMVAVRAVELVVTAK
jgi:hypothetical protein